ncbi:MAG: hypothetical protein ACLTXI_02715 [Collinsella sp.]
MGRHGVHLAIPEGMFRAPGTALGLSCNHGITLANAPGIIDPLPRRDSLQAANLSDEPDHGSPLERIAMVFLPFVNAISLR